MEIPTQNESVASVRETVRKAAPATLIGAALMLYFGFVHMAQPIGDDLFHRAASVLYYTLRLGGLAFVGVTALLYAGVPAALMVDAVLSIPTGVVLAGCGVGMILDGGDALNTIILLLCGASFVSSGWRNGQEYRRIATHSPTRSALT